MIQPKKSLGQHWLSDEKSLQAMCDAVDIEKGEFVLEIGPGTGELTQVLIDSGAQVFGIEKDPLLVNTLRTRFNAYPIASILINEGDIRTFDFAELPDSYKIVANIPYYLTAHLLRILTEVNKKPLAAALLVQKEVAQRVVAGPGKMSAISVFVQFFYEVTVGMVIPAELFTPPPKVNSQILILKQRHAPLFANVDKQRFFRLVKAGFSSPRKKLRSSLAGGLRMEKNEVEALLDKAYVNPGARAQELSLEDWRNIYLVTK